MIWLPMKLLLDYRKNAAECRKIARLISLRDDRERLLKMAEEWEFLAAQREAYLGQQPNMPRGGTDDPRVQSL
jgi:hypothetical protein